VLRPASSSIVLVGLEAANLRGAYPFLSSSLGWTCCCCWAVGWDSPGAIGGTSPSMVGLSSWSFASRNQNSALSIRAARASSVETVRARCQAFLSKASVFFRPGTCHGHHSFVRYMTERKGKKAVPVNQDSRKFKLN
jgi:hypothetical protein